MSPERIRALLTALGWSQAYLGHRLGVSRVFITRLCNGRATAPQNLADWLEKGGGYLTTQNLPEGWKAPQED